MTYENDNFIPTGGLQDHLATLLRRRDKLLADHHAATEAGVEAATRDGPLDNTAFYAHMAEARRLSEELLDLTEQIDNVETQIKRSSK